MICSECKAQWADDRTDCPNCGTTSHPDTEVCCDKRPIPPRFLCTRPAGHEGEHSATVTNHTYLWAPPEANYIYARVRDLAALVTETVPRIADEFPYTARRLQVAVDALTSSGHETPATANEPPDVDPDRGDPGVNGAAQPANLVDSAGDLSTESTGRMASLGDVDSPHGSVVHDSVYGSFWIAHEYRPPDKGEFYLDTKFGMGVLRASTPHHFSQRIVTRSDPSSADVEAR